LTTETKRKFLIDLIFYSVIIALSYFVLKFLASYLLPFVIGIFVSFLVQSPVKVINQKLKIAKGPLTIAFVVTTYILTVAIIVVLVYLIYRWLSGIVSVLPGMIPDFLEFANNLNASLTQAMRDLPKAVTDYINSLPAKITETVASLGLALSNWALNIATNIPSYLISIIVTVVASCYIAYDYDKIVLFAKRKTPTKIWNTIIDIKNTFFRNIFKMLKGYIFLMLITFVELSLGFLLIGQKNAILLGAIICVIDVLPVLGTGAVVIPWALISLFTGNIWKAIGLILIYIIITIVRNFLEPKVIGNQVGLHPLITLLSMFCGLKLLGIIGLFGFPLTLIVINDLYKNGKLKFNFSSN
jgi:sporulation integral membrane protein YtvI